MVQFERTKCAGMRETMTLNKENKEQFWEEIRGIYKE
jgi:hypothetical protein